ncbi:hypothetical protein ACFE04_030004 [Oxalis oulophora]
MSIPYPSTVSRTLLSSTLPFSAINSPAVLRNQQPRRSPTRCTSSAPSFSAINSRASSSQPQSTAARPLPSHNNNPISPITHAVSIVPISAQPSNNPLEPLPSRAPPFAQKP